MTTRNITRSCDLAWCSRMIRTRIHDKITIFDKQCSLQWFCEVSCQHFASRTLLRSDLFGCNIILYKIASHIYLSCFFTTWSSALFLQKHFSSSPEKSGASNTKSGKAVYCWIGSSKRTPAEAMTVPCLRTPKASKLLVLLYPDESKISSFSDSETLHQEWRDPNQHCLS